MKVEDGGGIGGYSLAPELDGLLASTTSSSPSPQSILWRRTTVSDRCTQILAGKPATRQRRQCSSARDALDVETLSQQSMLTQRGVWHMRRLHVLPPECARLHGISSKRGSRSW